MSAARRILVAFQLPEALHDLLAGVSRYVRQTQAHWQVLLCVSAHEFRAAFVRQFADGAIIGLGPRSQHIITHLRRRKTPVVNAVRDLSPRVPSVLSDNTAVGRIGGEYLLDCGFRNFAFIGVDTPWSRARRDEFLATVARAAAPAPRTLDLHLKDFEYSPQMPAMRLLSQWIKKLPPRTAVFCSTDFIARSLLGACETARVKVPEQIAVLGVDNFPSECQIGPVTLSSVAQDFERIGFECAALLHRLMETSARPPTTPVLVPPGRVHVRTSTDTLAFEDPLIVSALRIIRTRSAAGLSMKELLAEIPLSRKWLDHRFKAAVGHTPSEEIRRCRMQAITDLLIETDMSLGQIATRCRFSCVQNLIRCFRQTRGLSPEAFRRRARAQGV